MSGQEVPQGGEVQDVQVWEPLRVCRNVTPMDAALSKGFLRCRPEKWFPGLPAQWMPIAHAFGCEISVSDIKPIIAQPPKGVAVFKGLIAGEPILLAMDEEASAAIASEVVPGAEQRAADVVLEYLVRRLFFSLVTSWSGEETSAVSFEGPVGAQAVSTVASVRLTCLINTTPVVIWFGLGERMVQTLDGLWRRQVRSTFKGPATPSPVRFEVAQLGVPPQMLSEYLKAGTVIDLEVRASDMLTVRLGAKSWMPGRMVNVNGRFGCEMVPGAVSVGAVPEGTTRLSVEIGLLSLEAGQIAELGQAGAIAVTDTPIGETVSLAINQEVVGKARLCVYEGRFAIEVL